MSDPADNSALVELLAEIADRRIRRKVKKLVEFGSEAVRSLGELDSALYSRENGEDELQVISDAVLSHVRRLLAYLASIAPAEGSEETGEHEIGIEFATGDSLDLTDAVAAVLAKRTGLVELPAPVQPVKAKSDEEKWRELATEMDSMQYGLGSELNEFDRRFSEALKLDRKEQALRDLNDATNSLLDGVFAMLTTAYELFLGHADPDRMIPGYRDTLGKAIAVRKCTTELRREVQELNRTIQNPESDQMVVEMSYSLLLESLMNFIRGDDFASLRPSDRQEFADFWERLQEGNASSSRLDCEGLDKYLDSLAVVSQRDVLLKHDVDLREKICAELEGALALGDSYPTLVLEAIQLCFVRAERLFGLIEELDSLVYRWSTRSADKREDVHHALEMARMLQELVELPKKTPPPPVDGDFF